MNIWKLKYTLRRYNPQKRKKGYTTRSHTDTTVYLNVQPIDGKTEVTAEGKRCPKHIKSFGTFPIRTENVKLGIQADRLFYDGAWYQCTQSVYWEHTPLAHYESEFALVSEAVAPSDVQAPSETEADANGGNE